MAEGGGSRLVDFKQIGHLIEAGKYMDGQQLNSINSSYFFFYSSSKYHLVMRIVFFCFGFIFFPVIRYARPDLLFDVFISYFCGLYLKV